MQISKLTMTNTVALALDLLSCNALFAIDFVGLLSVLFVIVVFEFVEDDGRRVNVHLGVVDINGLTSMIPP